MFAQIRRHRKLLLFILLVVAVAALIYSQLSGEGFDATNFSIPLMEELDVLNQQPSAHRLAVLIPFRNTFDELQQFVPYMSQFLANQSVPHEFFVINQVDDYRFNRASLLNIGFLYVKEDPRYDYLAMHDVDLLPLNPELKYKYPGNGQALHIAGPKLHPTYHYPNFVGGILLLTLNDYDRLNGLSNKYWGWGREDDDFFWRMKRGRVAILRPVNVSTGTKNSFRHLHTKRVRDKKRCLNQMMNIRKVDTLTGIRDVRYQIESINTLSINGSAPVNLLNVKLACNRIATPWCKCGK